MPAAPGGHGSAPIVAPSTAHGSLGLCEVAMGATRLAEETGVYAGGV